MQKGGGVYLYRAKGDKDEHLSGIIIRGGIIANNAAKGTGGGVSGFDSRVWLDSVKIENNRVEAKSAPGGRIQATGGGVYLYYGDSYIGLCATAVEGCSFLNNRVDVDVEVEASDEERVAGGGLSIASFTRLPLRLNNLTFAGNKSQIGKHISIPPKSNYKTWNGQWDDTKFATPSDDDPLAIYTHPDPSRIQPPEIVLKHRLPEDCYGERPSDAKINAVVIHFISAEKVRPNNPYDLKSILAIFRGELGTGGVKSSAHYLIDREGQVFSLVDEDKRAWHAGYSKMPGSTGKEGVNDFSIGIELVRRSVDPPTANQYDSLVRLLCDVKRRHQDVTIASIVGHDTIRSEWLRMKPNANTPMKLDPGPLFHWSYLIHRLVEVRFGR